MNETLLYLLKVSAAIALLTLPYYLALRNDASLVVKRIYLVSGILLSWTFPLLTVRKPAIIAVTDPVFVIDPGVANTATAEAVAAASAGISAGEVLTILYMTGILVFLVMNLTGLTRLTRQADRPSARKNVVLTRSDKVFTLSPKIYLPQKYDDPKAIDTILIHERAHIRQLHVVDLLISEISLALTWFNPFSWLISRMIKENHEHLADREVLSRGVNPAHYKALLLNHAVGGEVFRLGHRFNHSLTKKRFNMMKKMKATKRGVLKYIVFVPAILAFTLMATAAVEQPRTVTGKVYLESKAVPATGASVVIAGTTMGTVVDEQGAFTLEVTGNPRIAISYVGYETAMVTAKQVEKDPVVLVPTTYEIKLSDQTMKWLDKKQKEVFIITEDDAGEGGKKTEVKVIAENGKEPVYIVNGKKVKTLEDLDPEIIEKIEVIKDGDDPVMKKFKTDAGVVMITTKKKDGSLIALKEDSMTVFVKKVTRDELTGEEGEEVEFEVEIDEDIEAGMASVNDQDIEVEVEVTEKEVDGEEGEVTEYIIKKKTESGEKVRKKVIVKGVDADKEITWKSKDEDEEMFYIVEDVPSFPGGNEELGVYIDENLEYPAKAKKNSMAGKVMVEFKVNADGSLSDIRVAQSSNPLFDKAALKVFEDMPAWNPGVQRGKKVACKVIVPVRFIPGQE